MDRGTVEAAEVLEGGVRHHPQVRNASLVEPDEEVISRMEARLETCRGPVGAGGRGAFRCRRAGGGDGRHGSPFGSYHDVNSNLTLI